VLYGKRVCSENGVEPTFGFQLKAVFKKYPYATFGVLAILCVFVDAYIIRVWERPYFELTFDPPYLEFSDMRSAIWYAIISMTSVGFGNIVASTNVGRICAIFTIINGAWLLALLIGLILQWFDLPTF
jgi:hypothetical protein